MAVILRHPAADAPRLVPPAPPPQTTRHTLAALCLLAPTLIAASSLGTALLLLHSAEAPSCPAGAAGRLA